jgi:hypothetical protein
MINRKNQFLILHVTSALLVLALTLLGAPVYAQTSNHLSVTSPSVNGIVSSGFQVIGTYQSNVKTPEILIELNNVNYTASASNGVFSYTTSIPDGTYNMIIYLFDTTTTYRSSVQFNQISNHLTQTKYNLIVPNYGESCIRMIQSGDYSECPPLKDIMYADTSNQAISGHIVMKKDGIFVRESPQAKNHYQFYTNMTDKKVCVDCYIDLGSSNAVQQIVLEASSFPFTSHEFTTVTSNQSYTDASGNIQNYTINRNENNAGLVVYHDWFADSSCNTVTIHYSKERYDDAIAYLKSGCISHAYNGSITTTIPNHPFSLTSPFSSLQQDNYLEQIFHGHKTLTNEHMPTGGGLGPGNCIGKTKCAFTDPYKKKGY